MLGDPRSGSKVWKAPDREIGKPGENRRQIVAHPKFQPATAFHDREKRRNLRSRLWAADVQPILSTKSHRTHGILRKVMKIGGWRTRSVFERYAIVSQSDIADAIGRLEVRDGHSLGHSDANKEETTTNSTN